MDGLDDLCEGIAECLLETETQRFCTGSMLRMTASTRSPTLTTSDGLWTFLPQAISLMWMRPSTPGAISTKEPKSASRVTMPLTFSPSWKRSETLSHGWGWSCLRPTAMRRFAASAESILRIFTSMMSPSVDDLGRVGDAVPGQVRDMQESICPVEIHEGAEISEGADGAANSLSFGKLGEALIGVGAGFFFEDAPPVDDGIRA